jgi:hypothetical protein
MNNIKNRTASCQIGCTNVEVHEQGHSILFNHFGVKCEVQPRQSVPEPGASLLLHDYIAVLVAGAVAEHAVFPEQNILWSVGGDAAIIARLLGAPTSEHLAYATCLASIIIGNVGRLPIPEPHQTLLREAVRRATHILKQQEQHNAI